MQLFGSKFVKNAYSCFVDKNQRKRGHLLCFSKWLNNAVFAKQIAVGLKLT